jgi:hypothetical protein
VTSTGGHELDIGYNQPMTMTADDILEHIRALPERERLRLVERVVHEVVEQKSSPGSDAASPPSERSNGHWADVSDEEFDAFMKAIRASRSEPWRTVE